MSQYEEHYEKSCDLRNNFWSKVGEVHSDVLSPALNPGLAGTGPVWPSIRQAFKFIKTANGTIITSDGLTDPYNNMDTNQENAKYNGFGMEVFVETPDDLTPTNAKETWQFQMLYQMAQQVAHFGNLVNQIAKYKFITTELYDVNVPDEFRNSEERVGVILGLPSDNVPAQVELSLEPVQMINLKLLTLDELNYAIEKGADGRNQLAQAFEKSPEGSLSSLSRSSVMSSIS